MEDPRERLPMGSVAQKVLAACETAIEDLGYECVHVDFRSSGGHGRAVLRVFIDRSRGVSLDDCVVVSRELDVLLDVEDVVPGAYSLEVSSPGLDRPIGRVADFERFRGETVALETTVPIGERKRWRGVLCGMTDRSVRLRVDGETVLIPVERIKKANIVYAFDRG